MSAPPITVDHVTNYTPGRAGQTPTVITHHVMMGSFDVSRAWFNNPESEASSNYAIAPDGTIYELVAPINTAWANGNLRDPQIWIPEIKRVAANGINPNAVTLSVEWAGAHELYPGAWQTLAYRGPKKAEWVDTIRRKNGVKHWWGPTPAQWAAGVALTAWLCDTHGIPRDRLHILRHSDWDSVAKWFCPGAGFNLAAMLRELTTPPG